jgi:predicted ATPase
LLRQLSLHGGPQPLRILAVEDLHWIDPTSEEWLASLVEQMAGAALLLVVTYRPGYRPPWLVHSAVTQLALTPLTSRESLAVVQAVPQAGQLPAHLQQAIVTKAAGNPFFLEELTWAAVDGGAPGAGQLVPDTIQAVLAMRIDRLLPMDKHVLQTAAVIGKDVPIPLLQAVMALPEAALHTSLERLQASECLYETRLAPALVYTFTHALLQEVAYQSLLRSTRQQVHQGIAQVLAERFPEAAETQPKLLAHHYTEAGCAEQALVYWQRAGVRARERSANQETVVHLTQGLELLRTLPETPARIQQELEMQIILAYALIVTKGFTAPAVEHAFARARALCRQVGDTPWLFEALVGLRVFYLNQGDLQTAQELAEQQLTLAQRLHDAALLRRAHFELGGTWYWLGKPTAAAAHLEQARALPQEGIFSAFRHAPSGVPYLAHVAWTLWTLGYPDQALTWSQEALTLAQELAHAYSVVRALHYASVLHGMRREWAIAQERAEASLALATEQGFVHWVGNAMLQQGMALAQQGHYEKGIAQISQGLAAKEAAGALLSRSVYLARLAAAYGESGQAEAGLRLVAEALAWVDTTGERFYEAEVYRIKGELLLRQAVPDAPQAEACFQQALTVARRQQAKSVELREATSLARLWQQQGKRAAAYDLLAPLYSWFTEGFDTPDLQDARALLEALA